MIPVEVKGNNESLGGSAWLTLFVLFFPPVMSFFCCCFCSCSDSEEGDGLEGNKEMLEDIREEELHCIKRGIQGCVNRISG